MEIPRIRGHHVKRLFLYPEILDFYYGIKLKTIPEPEEAKMLEWAGYVAGYSPEERETTAKAFVERKKQIAISAMLLNGRKIKITCGEYDDICSACPVRDCQRDKAKICIHRAFGPTFSRNLDLMYAHELGLEETTYSSEHLADAFRKTRLHTFIKNMRRYQKSV